jgi:uncharacterized membrane protein
MKKQSILYYVLRVLQRFALLTVIGWTIVLWIVLITTVVQIQSVQSQGSAFTDPEMVEKTIKQAIDMTSYSVLRTGITAMILSGVLLLLTRVRKFEKRLVVDSLIIIIFCIFSAMFAQMLTRQFVSRLT